MNEERGTRDDPRAEPDGVSRPGGSPYPAGPVPAGGSVPGRAANADAGAVVGGGIADGDGQSAAAGRGTPAGRGGPAVPPQASTGARTGRPGPPGSPEPGGRARRGKGRSRSWWIELPILLAFALVLALLIKTFVVQAFFIPSSSMENTLEIGDKVLVNKLVYDFRPVHRGDVVVFNGEGSWDPVTTQSAPPLVRLWNAIAGLFGTAPGVHDYIKRVIGVPGDHVACCDARGRVTVNGVPLSETSYLYPGNPPSSDSFHITVPRGRLWVMGDHRSVSYDSRGHMQDPGDGTIPEDRVVGRAFVIVAPVSRWRVLSIPTTFDQPRLAGARATARPALPSSVATAVPVGAGLAGAVPLTWLQLRLRRRLARSLRRARFGRRPPAGRRGARAVPGRPGHG
jgi:signal peptidase I